MEMIPGLSENAAVRALSKANYSISDAALRLSNPRRRDKYTNKSSASKVTEESGPRRPRMPLSLIIKSICNQNQLIILFTCFFKGAPSNEAAPPTESSFNLWENQAPVAAQPTAQNTTPSTWTTFSSQGQNSGVLGLGMQTVGMQPQQQSPVLHSTQTLPQMQPLIGIQNSNPLPQTAQIPLSQTSGLISIQQQQMDINTFTNQSQFGFSNVQTAQNAVWLQQPQQPQPQQLQFSQQPSQGLYPNWQMQSAVAIPVVQTSPQPLPSSLPLSQTVYARPMASSQSPAPLHSMSPLLSPSHPIAGQQLQYQNNSILTPEKAQAMRNADSTFASLVAQTLPEGKKPKHKDLLSFFFFFFFFPCPSITPFLLQAHLCRAGAQLQSLTPQQEPQKKQTLSQLQSNVYFMPSGQLIPSGAVSCKQNRKKFTTTTTTLSFFNSNTFFNLAMCKMYNYYNFDGLW